MSRSYHERYTLPTGNIAVKRPYESYYMDPVYNNVDADNDDVPDNPVKFCIINQFEQDKKIVVHYQLVYLLHGQNH